MHSPSHPIPCHSSTACVCECTITNPWINEDSAVTKYLQSGALIRERRTEEHHQNVHHRRRHIVLQNFVGMVAIVSCYGHLPIKTLTDWWLIALNLFRNDSRLTA